jgi:hypothetical protein
MAGCMEEDLDEDGRSRPCIRVVATVRRVRKVKPCGRGAVQPHEHRCPNGANPRDTCPAGRRPQSRHQPHSLGAAASVLGRPDKTSQGSHAACTGQAPRRAAAGAHTRPSAILRQHQRDAAGGLARGFCKFEKAASRACELLHAGHARHTHGTASVRDRYLGSRRDRGLLKTWGSFARSRGSVSQQETPEALPRNTKLEFQKVAAIHGEKQPPTIIHLRLGTCSSSHLFLFQLFFFPPFLSFLYPPARPRRDCNRSSLARKDSRVPHTLSRLCRFCCSFHPCSKLNQTPPPTHQDIRVSVSSF